MILFDGVDKNVQCKRKTIEKAEFNKCGESGLYLPKISLGLWQNFGDNADYDEMKDIILTAFDMGVTHFDLANNYGPNPERQR